MITPIELQSKTFKNGFGYDKKDVDNFLHELLSGYESMYKQNMELNDKINTLNEGISYYKTIEKTLQKALVLAEQTAEETREAARKQARAIEEEAKGKAKLIVADAVNELHQLQQQTLQLIRQYDSYKAQFKHLAAAQCELLESDTFKIHIANLEAFIEKETLKEELNQQKDTEIAEHNSINEYAAPEIMEEESTAEEDFEFYNLNDEEKE